MNLPPTEDSLTRFSVEFEGYNDGHPYQVGRYKEFDLAKQALDTHKEKTLGKVRHRIVYVVEDWA